MNVFKLIKNGIFDENPIFVLVVGMCPTLAVSTSVVNAIGMGLSATAVLTCSNLVISLIRKIIPDKVRIPCYIVVIASFVTIVQFLLQGFFPDLNKALGIFIPLIVVNCIILARAEAFAGKNGPVASFFDGIGMGLGFTLALVIIATFREILGNGTFLDIALLPDSFPKTLVMILAPGAFFTLGLVMGFIEFMRRRKKA